MTTEILLFIFGLCLWTSSALPDYDHVSMAELLETGFGDRLDPEFTMNATEIIEYHGYPAEEYQVTTSDGYMIYIQRIPHGRNESYVSGSRRPVVLLQHGLLVSSTNWITNLPNESLGFILADAGYDVWLGNMRGNVYGLKHKSFPITSKEFWDFTFDEMAAYDLPAIIKKALAVSGAEQLSYVGHSQGTLIGFAKFSSDQELAKKIRVFIALAPVAFLGNMKSPLLRLIAPFARELAFLFRLFGYRDFLPDYPLIQYLAEKFCIKQPIPARVCENVIFIVAGYDFAQINSTRLDVYLSHAPAGTSSQNIFHFAQLAQSNKCQKFDYGSDAENMKYYGQITPPEYPVSALKVPTAMLYSDNDWLATPVDVLRLKEELSSVVDFYRVPYANWDHLDFIWGVDANKYVYPEVQRVLRQYANSTRRATGHRKLSSGSPKKE
ncbi:Lysosomal acid lipase/cholesteryl ester hydrolase [Hypsibius exemplaris]|uniref:Lipase n=1 Tax=Hypsibius exemplaris TaxID=2072580 RepID=A0A9X6NIA5_HYPEX|nr:Lysosomal acid lipase/cholesteryl ester hydrolase [Hypsibius exemplaris]